MVALSRNLYLSGKHTYGPYDLPQGVSQFSVSFERFETLGNGNRKTGTEWPDIRDAQDVQQNAFSALVEISLDNGATWKGVAGATYVGGVYVDRNNNEVQYSTLSASLPDSSSTTRKIRGSIEAFTNLQTEVDITWS